MVSELQSSHVIPHCPLQAVIFLFLVVTLGFMIEQMPVCKQANEVAQYSSEIRLTLRRRDQSLFGALPSAPHRCEQRRQGITEVLTVPQPRILIGNWWRKKKDFLQL